MKLAVLLTVHRELCHFLDRIHHVLIKRSQARILLLDSALESAFATFGGEELYPGKEEKAAKIGFSLISNHAFVDGNKRIGVYVMLSFLELNGIRIEATDADVIRLGLSVADGSMQYEDVLAWIREHRV